MLRVRDILAWLNEYAPFRFAASWDQCGLQVGDPDATVDRILVALDPSSTTLNEAERLGCACLVTHHPLIFRPLSSVRLDHFPANLVARALIKGINLIAAHTNLDVARQGTNDHLARLLSLEKLEAMELDAAWAGESRYGGMGRVGFLPSPVRLAELADTARHALGAEGFRVVGDPDKRVHRVALCSGSGGSLIEQAIMSGCDAYITGDLKYHEAQRAVEAGMALLDVGHFASERVIVRPLAEYLRSQAGAEPLRVQVFAAREEKDPFWVCR